MKNKSFGHLCAFTFVTWSNLMSDLTVGHQNIDSLTTWNSIALPIVIFLNNKVHSIM